MTTERQPVLTWGRVIGRTATWHVWESHPHDPYSSTVCGTYLLAHDTSIDWRTLNFTAPRCKRCLNATGGAVKWWPR